MYEKNREKLFFIMTGTILMIPLSTATSTAIDSQLSLGLQTSLSPRCIPLTIEEEYIGRIRTDGSFHSEEVSCSLRNIFLLMWCARYTSPQMVRSDFHRQISYDSNFAPVRIYFARRSSAWILMVVILFFTAINVLQFLPDLVFGTDFARFWSVEAAVMLARSTQVIYFHFAVFFFAITSCVHANIVVIACSC
jgi:hypothetical protein